MASKNQFKPIPLKPLTGALDVRSRPDLMTPGSVRFRQNFASPQDLKLCRRAGWEKLLSQTPYNNQDLHDQLLPLQQYYADFVPVASGANDVTTYPSSLCDGSILSRTTGREYITYLSEIVSSTGFRKLIATTQSRIYELNERSGNWRLLADGMGGFPKTDLSVRFQLCQVKDTVLFTNDVDQPVAYQMFAPIQGCAMRAVTNIPDLDTIFLSKAACCAAFKNVAFLGNVEMDGQRLQNRIIWSDYNDATSWDPARGEIGAVIDSTLTGNVLSWSNPGSLTYKVQSRVSAVDDWIEVEIVQTDNLIVSDTSLEYRVVSFTITTIAGTQDLSYGHKILAITQLGDYLVVMTDRGIWQGTWTQAGAGGGAAFTFRCTYESRQGDKCLIYPNTLVSDGNKLYWLSRDGVYSYNFYQTEPEWVDWIHKADGVIFDGVAGIAAINTQCCQSHVAGYRAVEKEIWISWAVLGSCIPSRTLVLNVDKKVADIVDAGFTCFTSYRSDSRGSLRDFMLDFCVCTSATLVANGITFLKEGLPLASDPASCVQTPDSLYTTETRDIGGNPANGQMEDYDAEPSANSLCSILGGRTIDDLCRDCNQSQLFIGADVADWCLKQIGTSYNRERCTNPTARGVVFVDVNGIVTYASSTGTYRLDGYYSILRTQPMSYGLEEVRKLVERFLISFEATDQAYPCVLQLRIGVSYQPEDPNVGTNTNPNTSQNASQGCGVVWQQTVRKMLTCPNALSPEQFADQNLVPNMGMEDAISMEAQWLYYEIVIANLVTQSNINGQLAPATGGASCFSSLTTWVKPMTLDR